MKHSSLPTAIDTKVLQAFRAAANESASTFLAELIDCYLEETPEQLQAMEAAVAQGDVNALRQETHTLKSSSAALGARNLAKLCKELEIVSANQELENLLEKVLQLKVEYERVKAALQVERQQGQI